MSSNESQSEMISQFMGVTGADEDRAKFFLESSAWELQVAIAAFFDDDAPMEEESIRPPIPEPVDEDLPPSAPAGASSGISRSTGPVKQPKKPSSRFATIGDLRDEQQEDEDSGEEGQRFYAGGADHGSGQQVVGPRKKKNTDSIVKDLFKSAKEHGAEEVTSGSAPGSSSQSSFVFRGAAYRLGELPTDSTQPVPGTAGTLPIPKAKEQHVVLKLWKNGFSVDDGPLRDFKTPENEQFLASIRRGEIPMELIQNAAGGEVNLDLEDHRDEDYQKPKPQRKAFEGRGYMLGNLTPPVTGESSQSQAPPAASSNTPSDTAAPSWDVDTSQPVTTLQLRLGNGTRLTGKFNHSHTVGDVRRFIALSKPEFATTSYKLMTTFPNKVLDDDSQTLSDANLLNAVIVQRLT